MTNKTHQLGVRLDADVWRRLEDLQRLTSLDKVALVRAAIMAMLEAAEREGGIKFPLRIVSEVGGNGVLVAVVERINRPNIAEADPQIIEATRLYAERPCMREALQAGAPPYCGVSTSVVEAAQGEIVSESNVRRHERVITSTFRASTATEEDAQQ